MKKIYLYIKESPKGLKYLGKTTQDPFLYLGSGLIWKRHIKKNKFDFNDIKTVILLESFDKNEIKKMGLYYSKIYNVVNEDNWANLRPENGDGGDTSHCANYKPPPIIKGDKHWTKKPEAREYLSKKISGDKNPAKRDDVRQKISKSKIGKKLKLSDDARKKMSESRLGENNSFYGKTHTTDVKNLMKEKAKGRYTIDWFISKYGKEIGLVKRNEFLERSKHAAKLNKGVMKKEHICPKCNFKGRGGNMKRYHFDNCKIYSI